eukprot:1981484-Prymnesium_polylepis.1
MPQLGSALVRRSRLVPRPRPRPTAKATAKATTNATAKAVPNAGARRTAATTTVVVTLTTAMRLTTHASSWGRRARKLPRAKSVKSFRKASTRAGSS